MLRNITCLLTWLAFLGVIIFTPLNYCGILDNPKVPIIAISLLLPLAFLNLFLECQRRKKKMVSITDTETRKGKSHGSESGGKAEEILGRIVTNLRVVVATDENDLEVHMITLDGYKYHHVRQSGNGGYVIDLNPTLEVQRALDEINEAQP